MRERESEDRLCVCLERDTTRVTGAGAEAGGILISDRFLPVRSQ